MNLINLEPIEKKKHNTIYKGSGCGDLPVHKDGGVNHTWWKCKSIKARIIFLFCGEIHLQQISDKVVPTAIGIDTFTPPKDTEPNKEKK